ncbi:hypothetical protein ACFQ4O_16890, partial [Methylopila musalis]
MTSPIAPVAASQPSSAPTGPQPAKTDDSFARALDEAAQNSDDTRTDAQTLAAGLAETALALVAAPTPVVEALAGDSAPPATAQT